MKKTSSDGFFWPSFTDLMTSLFFIMLVLYVLTYITLQNERIATQQQLDKIRRITDAVKALDTRYFRYDQHYQRYSLTREIHFESQQAVIADQDTAYLADAGRSVSRLIDRLRRTADGKEVRYMVVIEGMSSADNYERNFLLSYQRAQALRVLWIGDHIKFDPAVCELQISGSGTQGIGRDTDESKNQRILIQIVPKIGDLVSSQ